MDPYRRRPLSRRQVLRLGAGAACAVAALAVAPRADAAPLGGITATVIAVGGTSAKRGSTEFAVVPSIRLSSVSGPTGTAVTATLRGYAADQAISIVWRHAASSVIVATVTASYSGSASVAFMAPASIVGAHAVEGVAAGGGRAAASFTIAPSMNLSPGTAAPGVEIRATLRGFGRYESISLTWTGGGDSATALVTAASSATGSANAVFAVPTGAGEGVSTVTAAGLTSGATVSLPFTVIPAEPPTAEPTATPDATATPPPEPTMTPPPEPTETPLPEPTATPTVPPTVTPVLPPDASPATTE